MSNKLPAGIKANWADGIAQELKKVNWPTRRESLQLTLVVVIISFLLGIYIGVFDYIFAYILKLIIK